MLRSSVALRTGVWLCGCRRARRGQRPQVCRPPRVVGGITKQTKHLRHPSADDNTPISPRGSTEPQFAAPDQPVARHGARSLPVNQYLREQIIGEYLHRYCITLPYLYIMSTHPPHRTTIGWLTRHPQITAASSVSRVPESAVVVAKDALGSFKALAAVALRRPPRSSLSNPGPQCRRPCRCSSWPGRSRPDPHQDRRL